MRTIRLVIAVTFAAVALVSIPLRQAQAFTLYPCHDDTSIPHDNTHGSPLNGTFGDVGQSPNHGHGYYYLQISTVNHDGSSCVTSQDGLVHLVGKVTATGIGLLPGHPVCDRTAWFPSTAGTDSPPCDPQWAAVTGSALAAEDPTWGFEIKDALSAAVLACTGGDGSGGSDCPGTLNVTASPGDATVEFRYDGPLPSHGARFRLANQYTDNGKTDVLWETASFDVVACSTCEP